MSLVAYMVNQGNQLLAILVGNIPVLFLLNITLAYRVGGATSSIAYAKGALISMPFFIIFVLIVLLILPRINTTAAILPAMLVYIIPPFLLYRRRHHAFKSIEVPVQHTEEGQMASSITPELENKQY